MSGLVPKRGFRYLRLFVLMLVASLVWTCSATGELAVRYDVTIEGVDQKSLRELLESASNTVAYKEKPPATLSLLEHRARSDIPELVQALKSVGYYAAEVNLAIDEKSDPPRVTFKVSPGPPYLLRSVKIEKIEPPEASIQVKLPSPNDIGLKLEEPARAASIIEAKEKLSQSLKKQGFPFATVKDQKVVVDHSTRLVTVNYLVNPGPSAGFGKTRISGLESVEEGFVRGLLPWREGDRFNSDLLAQTQKKLVDSRLFSLVQFKTGETLDEKGRVPIILDLKEGKHRTISAGATYQTDEGPGAKIAWERRNFLGGGELLKLQVGASMLGFSGEGLFRIPQFLRDNQTLFLTSRLARDDTDAFLSNNMDTAVLLEREIRKGMLLGAGPAFRVSQISETADQPRTEEFAHIYFKSYFKWDTTDNLLDPTRGGRLEVQLAPYMNTMDTGASFVKTRTSYSRYFKISEKPYLIFAGRAALGSIAGADRESVPADLRYYAGGGGSVRGFGFQLASPLVGETPLGGNSVLELSMELRTKVTEQLGFVAFVDGGNAFESSVPDFGTTLRWGGGVGVRYFTPIGPLRLDIATPINGSKGIDDLFQVYLSIGQAF